MAPKDFYFPGELERLDKEEELIDELMKVLWEIQGRRGLQKPPL